MAKPKSPCLDCCERFEACHDTCIKHLEYKSQMKEFSKQVNTAKYSNSPKITGRVGYQRKYDSFATKNELYK